VFEKAKIEIPEIPEKRALVKRANVTRHSFGVLALNQDHKKEVVNLILKNTTLPTEVTERFGTELANQETVEIRIMENEESDPEQAIEIGKAILELPAGLPAQSEIDVTFRLNEEGRLEMTAVEITDDRKISVSLK